MTPAQAHGPCTMFILRCTASKGEHTCLRKTKATTKSQGHSRECRYSRNSGDFSILSLVLQEAPVTENYPPRLGGPEH